MIGINNRNLKTFSVDLNTSVEIAELVNAKIDATDMHPDILIIWAYLKFKNGEKKEAGIQEK